VQISGKRSNRKSYAAYVDDRPQDAVFRIDRSVYNDPEILEAEYRYIFESDWVFLCHDGHVPKSGDYFATHIGRQPVFVVRKPDGTLACFLNACGHRGATLVTARTGNSTSFTCPYHGFCFDTAGKCTAVTAPKTGWSEAHLDRDVSHGRGHLGHDDLVEDGIGGVAREQEHRAATDRRRKARLPDLVPSHRRLRLDRLGARPGSQVRGSK